MSSKRSAEYDSESSDDDDYGPAPVQSSEGVRDDADADNGSNIVLVAKTKRRKLQHEKIFVDNLPSSTFYEHSYMHRDFVTHVVVSKSLDFIITGSCDGHVKFWKKMLTGIEFVKHYQAHIGPINSMVVSPDGQRLATTSDDRMIKFFDVSCYDMTNMISVPNFSPGAATWISSGERGGQGMYSKVAVADKGGSLIRIYAADDSANRVEGEVTLHAHPVKCMDLNVVLGAVVSVDAKGMIEYWSCSTLTAPSPDDPSVAIVSFRYKTETDLYALAKAKVVPGSITVSPRGDLFAVTSSDKQIRVFDFCTGKLRRGYNESSAVYAHTSVASSTASHLSEHDLGRRLATEREIESDTDALARCNAVFDDSGNFLVYSSLTGVKILNIVTNRVVSTVGSAESGERFLAVALYQGTPKVDTQLLLARSAGSGKSQTSEELSNSVKPDPTLFCTSFKKRRFFCISRRDPDESEEARDVLNEKPTEDERVTTQTSVNSALGSEAIITTPLGEIRIKLFADVCPKTVENFCTHARNGYYDNIKFHRVIKGFMIQTGDPLGDGTGGESIWGSEFADEFDRNLRHDRPYTVSMANAGPNTNGSQFFITTAPTPWLDNKHTVFGRVTSGFEVVSKIENKEVDKYDRPYDEVKMLSIAIKR